MKPSKKGKKKRTKKKRVKKGGGGNKPDGVVLGFNELGQILDRINNESNSDTELHNALGFNNDEEEEENFFNKKTSKNIAVPSFIVVALIGGIVALATS